MTALRIAGIDDLDQVRKLVRAFHEELQINSSEDQRTQAITPLLEGSPHGVIYLIGPSMAPIGYIAICFGWSIEFGGLDGFIDEFYLRPQVRNRGIGSVVLVEIPKALSKVGLKALHLEVRKDNHKLQALYQKLRFSERSDYMLMTLEC